MNPFGFFDAVYVALEVSLKAFGRKRRGESRRDRIRFAVLYVLLLLAGIGTCIFVIWQIYFQR
jgi:hypothetical protein